MLPWLVLLTMLSVISCGFAQYEPNCNGRQVIVQLFEWKWVDIALECERFIAPNGFCGVQISPPNEHDIIPAQGWPWWQRYQPVSYKLSSRSGTEAEFINMVQRCNAAGVRIYADAVVNHMAGMNQVGFGDAGSTFNTTGGNIDFPGVPYRPEHFTPRELCPSADGGIDNYQDLNNVRNCYLFGLPDLYTRQAYVRQTIADYLNKLVDIGVAGFHIDAARYVWPEDIGAIWALLRDLPTSQGFAANSRPFFYQAVLEDNTVAVKVGQYYDTGLVSEFRYTAKITYGIQNYEQLRNLVDVGWGMAITERALIFVDTHDTQRDVNFGPGSTTSYRTPREYKQAVAYTLAQEYGALVRVMSGYDFAEGDFGQGPPSYGNYSTVPVVVNPDGQGCGNGWVCEHRWNAIKRMVRFRNAVHGLPTLNYWNNGQAVAFSRGGKGFFAMSKYGNLTQTLQTGLPQGIYCNLITDCGTSIRVGADGTALIEINDQEEPIIAVVV